jgi:hypothetical protein
MNNPEANARHRIDAAASLDKLAANPMENSPAAVDRFVIRIDLGAGEVLTFDKSISIDPNDGVDDGAPARQTALPANKSWDDDHR